MAKKMSKKIANPGYLPSSPMSLKGSIDEALGVHKSGRSRTFTQYSYISIRGNRLSAQYEAVNSNCVDAGEFIVHISDDDPVQEHIKAIANFLHENQIRFNK